MSEDQNKYPVSPAEWDELFSRDPDGWFFGREASEMARVSYSYWKLIHGEKRGKLIDIGCGEGRDSVYYSKAGFDVTGIDSSPVAIEKCKRLASDYHLEVNELLVSDITQYELPSTFAILAAHNVLQFTGDKCLTLLKKWQESTPIGSFHTVAAFTREAESMANRTDVYRFDHNELKFYYRDWRIFLYGEDILWREPSQNYLSFAHIIAQKLV